MKLKLKSFISDASGLRGHVIGLTGDVSGLTGDASGLRFGAELEMGPS